MAYYYSHYTTPSAFMFLIGLLAELIIFLILYLIVSFKTNSFDTKSNAVFFIVACIPVILFHYFAAWSLTENGDKLMENFDKFGLFYPMKGYYISMLFMVVGLFLSYYKVFKSLIKDDNSINVVEYSVLTNFFRVWVVGLVGIFYCSMKWGNHEKIISGDAILLMLIARITTEFIANYYSHKSKIMG